MGLTILLAWEGNEDVQNIQVEPVTLVFGASWCGGSNFPVSWSMTSYTQAPEPPQVYLQYPGDRA